MINLLPPEEKNRKVKEYKLRLIVVNALLLSVAFLIGSILLLPSYFFADTIQKSAENEVIALKGSSESTERVEINNQLRITKERLTAISNQGQQTEFYEIIETISSYAGKPIKLDTVSYSRGSDGKESRLQLAGVADTRDDLLEFEQFLDDDEMFEDVDLPVSSLAKDQDIEFNIQIKGTF